MKTLVRLSLTVALLASFVVAPSAQTRPRRVGRTPNAPAAPAPTPAAPTRRAPQMERPSPQAERASTTQAPRGEVAEEVDEDEVVRVNASLVTVPVSVLDRDGRFIGGLRKEDFRVFEDGVEQQVAYFAPVEQPFTVALVIDTSGSTRFKLEDIQDAAIAFLDQLRPADRVIVVSFDDDVRVLSDVTNDRNALRAAIRRTRPGQRHAALRRRRPRHQPRAEPRPGAQGRRPLHRRRGHFEQARQLPEHARRRRKSWTR